MVLGGGYGAVAGVSLGMQVLLRLGSAGAIGLGASAVIVAGAVGISVGGSTVFVYGAKEAIAALMATMEFSSAGWYAGHNHRLKLVGGPRIRNGRMEVRDFRLLPIDEPFSEPQVQAMASISMPIIDPRAQEMQRSHAEPCRAAPRHAVAQLQQREAPAISQLCWNPNDSGLPMASKALKLLSTTAGRRAWLNVNSNKLTYESSVDSARATETVRRYRLAGAYQGTL